MSTTKGAPITDPKEVMMNQLQRLNDELLLRLQNPRLFETLLEAKTAEEEAESKAEAAPTPYSIRDVSAAD